MILDIVEEQLDDAGFLFERREGAFGTLDWCGTDLAKLDERLRASLAGLSVDPGLAWELAREFLSESPGGAFVATMLALELGRGEALREVEAAVMDAVPEVASGVSGACCLSESTMAVNHLQRWARHSDSKLRAVALEGLAFRRINAGSLIEEALASSCTTLRAVGLRAAGCMRSSALRARIEESAGLDDPELQAAALESIVLVEPHGARQRCLSALRAGGAASNSAVKLLGVLGSEEDTDTLEQLVEAEDRDLARAAILALGDLGYAESVTRLVSHLDSEELSGVAGVAMQRIVGEDCPWEEFESVAVKDGNEDTPWSPDDDLPEYSKPRITDWWKDNRERFPADARLRRAQLFRAMPPQPTTPLALVEHEALEYALANPGEPLPEPRTWSR
ncbi:MAG: HEAT repeat domain-containing protein [Planctomycetota bacterium]